MAGAPILSPQSLFFDTPPKKGGKGVGQNKIPRPIRAVRAESEAAAEM